MASISFHDDGLDITEIRIGMTASYSHRITDEDIKAYADISGDRNPVHLDESYAANSRFKRRIAHGFYSAGFFSAIFGTKFPGPGCVYISQTLNFKRPVYIGDLVIATVIVRSIDQARRRAVFDTICKVKQKVVIDGSAEVYIPPKQPK